jgi:hypothetical protein
MAQASESSSIADYQEIETRSLSSFSGSAHASSHGTTESKSRGLARCWLVEVRVWMADWEVPPVPPDLAECMTYGCGQLEKLDDVAQAYFEKRAKEEEDEDDNALSIPVRFRGYVEFTKQVTPARIQKWLETPLPGGQTASLFKAEPAYLKDREQHMRNRVNSDVRWKAKYDVIPRAPWQVGAPQRGHSGARTDFESIRELLREHGPEEGVRRVAEEFPGQFVRYASGITQLAQVVIPKVREEEQFRLRPWQAALAKIFKGPAHPRHIYWVEDPVGNAGKSRLTTYLCREMGAIELDGRQMDAAFAYTGHPIAIFDLARPVEAASLKDLYTVGEKLKNGQIYSSKYQSRLKTFQVPHVVYFSNSPPPVGVWSADRLQHIQLSEAAAFNAFSVDGAAPPPPPAPSGKELFEKLLADEEAAREALDAAHRNAKRQREEEAEAAEEAAADEAAAAERKALRWELMKRDMAEKLKAARKREAAREMGAEDESS